jgi:hypothetical protein
VLYSVANKGLRPTVPLPDLDSPDVMAVLDTFLQKCWAQDPLGQCRCMSARLHECLVRCLRA